MEVAVTLGSTAVVSHASKTQLVVTLSTAEAEYIAAGDGDKEALFVSVEQASTSLRTTRGLRL